MLDQVAKRLLGPLDVVEHDRERLLRARLPWREWVERLLLFLGVALLLAGVIFFFAYNWRDLSPARKFGVIEGALVLCVGLQHEVTHPFERAAVAAVRDRHRRLAVHSPHVHRA